MCQVYYWNNKLTRTSILRGVSATFTKNENRKLICWLMPVEANPVKKNFLPSTKSSYLTPNSPVEQVTIKNEAEWSRHNGEICIASKAFTLATKK